MNNYSCNIQRRREKSRCRYGQSAKEDIGTGFECGHCHAWVGTESSLSGVQNRNHCPYCLWSRHKDLYKAGDRLSACKGLMKPIGLTLKITGKKYGSDLGELMLIHICMECETLSINRIAADDDLEMVLSGFGDAIQIVDRMHSCLEAAGIVPLSSAENELIRARLLVPRFNLAEILFSASVAVDFITVED